MLSSEGSALARLILARQTLICRALELDATFEVLALIDSVRDDGSATVTPTEDPAFFSRPRRRLAAELVLLPALIAHLEGQIELGWRRLDEVSPRISD
jgi:hypothetical protein